MRLAGRGSCLMLHTKCSRCPKPNTSRRRAGCIIAAANGQSSREFSAQARKARRREDLRASQNETRGYRCGSTGTESKGAQPLKMESHLASLFGCAWRANGRKAAVSRLSAARPDETDSARSVLDARIPLPPISRSRETHTHTHTHTRQACPCQACAPAELADRDSTAVAKLR